MNHLRMTPIGFSQFSWFFVNADLLPGMMASFTVTRIKRTNYRNYWKQNTLFSWGALYACSLRRAFLEPLPSDERTIMPLSIAPGIWASYLEASVFQSSFDLFAYLLFITEFSRLVCQLITPLAYGICRVNHQHLPANLAFRQTQRSPLGATSSLMLRLPELVWGKGEGSCVSPRYMTGKSPSLHRKEATLWAGVRWQSSCCWNLRACETINGLKLTTFLDGMFRENLKGQTN